MKQRPGCAAGLGEGLGRWVLAGSGELHLPVMPPLCGFGNGGERAGSAPPGISHPPRYMLFPELWRRPLFLLNHRHEGEKAPKLAGAPPWTRRAWSHGLYKAEPAPKTWGLCPHSSLGTGLSLLCPTPYPCAEALTTALLCRRHLLLPLPWCSILWAVSSACLPQGTNSYSANTECLLCTWRLQMAKRKTVPAPGKPPSPWSWMLRQHRY